MTNNFHQPLDTGAAASSFNLNVPLQQLDKAIEDIEDEIHIVDETSLTELPGNVVQFTITTISAIYTRLRHVWSLRSIVAAPALEDDARYMFNNDGVPASYSSVTIEQTNGANVVDEQRSTVAIIFQADSMTGGGQPAGWRTPNIMEIFNNADTDNFLLVNGLCIRPDDAGLAIIRYGGVWKKKDALTEIDTLGNFGQIGAGSSYKLEGAL